jgi:hypothetical protein
MQIPKPATAIFVQETRTLLQTGAPEKSGVVTSTVADKIEELVLKVGYTNAQALSVVIQLLTNGKVRVDYRDYSQRLQLLSPSDIMSRSAAVEVFDSHMAILNVGNASSVGFTQKFVFQPPRIRLAS